MRGMWRVRGANARAAELAAGCRRRVRGAVALTFDDGPDPTFTPLVLDALAAAAVPATFFVVGEAAARHPDLVRRVVDEGHAVGSHTRSHPDLWDLDVAGIRRQVDEGRDMVAEAAGRRSDLFRPCKGHVDWQVATALRLSGVRSWLWTADPLDWHPDTTAADVVNRLGGVTTGDVVLLHDGLELPMDASASDRSRTVEALPVVIESLRRRGMRFTTLEATR